MARKRVNIYIDTDLHDQVTALLNQSPEPYSFSRLVSELVSDWHSQAQLGPQFTDATPEERRQLVAQLAMHQLLELANEVRTTLHKISLGKEDES